MDGSEQQEHDDSEQDQGADEPSFLQDRNGLRRFLLGEEEHTGVLSALADPLVTVNRRMHGTSQGRDDTSSDRQGEYRIELVIWRPLDVGRPGYVCGSVQEWSKTHVPTAGYNRRFRMRDARRYVVSGRVQGVGFRFFARDAAAREGLSGWVANRPDGSVEIEARGEAEALRRFEMAIRRGPIGARVDDVHVDLLPPRAGDSGFHIQGDY